MTKTINNNVALDLRAKLNDLEKQLATTQNIDKGYIEIFNEMVLKNPPDEFDIDRWNRWYDNYIKDSKSNPIDKKAIRIFLSLMIKNWDDKWFTSSIGSFDFDAIEIELQPWFSPEFLVLRKYFPNIQNVD